MSDVTPLPIPGAVDPAPGVGATMHDDEGLIPCTIIRAGPDVFWFRIDDFEGAERLWPAKRTWTYRAVRQRDGSWRESEHMRRVDVGARRRAAPRDRGVPGQRTPDQLAAAVDHLEPRLLKRRWYPMSYMLIPSILRSAGELLGELAAYDGPERERVAALHERLSALRAGFRNLGGGGASAASEEARG